MYNYQSFYPQPTVYPSTYIPQNQLTYSDRMAQLQQQPQQPQIQQPMTNNNQLQRVGLNGRMVTNVNEINVNEVPMDSVAFFPKQDMSEIYLKTWTSNGSIQTIVFKPEIEQKTVEQSTEKVVPMELSEETTAVFMRRFDDIAEQIGKLEKSIAPTVKPRTKKESEI